MKTKLLLSVLFISLINKADSQNYFVDTYAGNGTSGYVDGITYNARFDRPSSLCFDSLGNMYIAEWGFHNIRKITPAGMVSTLAGNGTTGFTNGTGSTAEFNRPSYIDIHEPTGDLYIADVGNECIRKVTQAGVVTTFAGTGVAGYVDGPVASAQFNALAGIAVADNGDIYVSDRNNHRIRKISGGVVSTVAGDGTSGFVDGAALSARFNVPTDIEIDAQGLVYIADRDNNRIRLLDPVAGTVSTYAGNGTVASIDGTLSGCSFDGPRGLCLRDNGEMYVVDQNGNTIRMIVAGNVTTIAGNGNAGYQDGPSQYAEFNLPWDVSYFQGCIYVAGDFDNSIHKIHKKFSPASIDENEEFNVTLFPNPAKDFVSIQMTSSVEMKESVIEIFNLNGQLIQTENPGTLNSGQIFTLNLSCKLYSKGEYVLVIRDKDQMLLTRKLIIE